MVRLIPRETKFFDMFAEVADNLVAAARVLSECLHHYDYERSAGSGGKDQRD